jgi:hypothetical protein
MMAGVSYTRAARHLHLLPLIFKHNATVFLLEDNATIFDDLPLITVAVTAATREPNARPIVLPFPIDVIEFANLGLLVLRERHILHKFLDGVRILQPRLVVSHYIGMV